MKTSTTKALTLSALLLSLNACVLVSPPTNEDTLTDADLIRAAQQKENTPTEGAQQWVIGVHNGIEVVKCHSSAQTSVRRIPCG